MSNKWFSPVTPPRQMSSLRTSPAVTWHMWQSSKTAWKMTDQWLMLPLRPVTLSVARQVPDYESVSTSVHATLAAPAISRPAPSPLHDLQLPAALSSFSELLFLFLYKKHKQNALDIFFPFLSFRDNCVSRGWCDNQSQCRGQLLRHSPLLLIRADALERLDDVRRIR